MTLEEMKKKVLGLIEELNPDNEVLTDDPDIATKINDVINQVQFELARIKKIPSYVEIKVREGELIDFKTIEKACGQKVYQLDMVRGIAYELKAQGTVIKVLEDGVAEVEFFRYPQRITESTKEYEFDLSPDVIEVLPYGVASDLLKSDVSADYGQIYANRYEQMLNRMDSRYATNMLQIEGGVSV